MIFYYGIDETEHNRTKPNEFKYPDNMKVQLTKDSTKTIGNDARMIEFIVNLKTGHFVSEWNAYEHHLLPNGQIDSDRAHYTDTELKQIANTESFNYGIPLGTNNAPIADDYKGSHKRLDISHPADSDLRKFATDKNHYVAEPDLGDGGRYVNIVGNGGDKDVKAWNDIQDNRKKEVYDKYSEWVNYKKKYRKSAGINEYLNQFD